MQPHPSAHLSSSPPRVSGGGSLAAAGALAGVLPAAASAAAPLASPPAAAPAAVFWRFWADPRAPRGVRPPGPGRGGMAGQPMRGRPLSGAGGYPKLLIRCLGCSRQPWMHRKALHEGVAGLNRSPRPHARSERFIHGASSPGKRASQVQTQAGWLGCHDYRCRRLR